MLLDNIEERENYFLEEVRRVENSFCSLYILGAALGARNVEALLRSYGIGFAGKLVNKQYYDHMAVRDSDVHCLEEVMESSDEPLTLIVAYNHFDKESLAQYNHKIKDILDYDCWSGLTRSLDNPNIITYQWVVDNADRLHRVYDSLEDDLSRESFVAFINQRISMKYGYLSKVRVENQYFPKDIIRMSDREVFVDCGAYIGDSSEGFIKALKEQGFDYYDWIYAFEPDEENYRKLNEREYDNFTCIKAGVSDKKGNVRFSTDDSSGIITDHGEESIDVDTIDNVVGSSEVTYIKMDIEGSELAALRGAKSTIVRCHPKLAVCIYHKPEDLFEIFEYIKGLNNDYRFYVRAYEDMAIELVLYAI